ncbi:hypothetical protein LTLLF_121315 [Microtus ochrogaster]|uniref:Uncharacterized protein n=1 Tax=Microtus ochrogaster TaxID=79684 RepID=A0A8J6L077_MICOH|nr:hypothetical protein LTLLF_121315 [Microtus ochrogaster]
MSGSSQDTDKNCPEQEFDEENRVLAQVPVFEEPAKEHSTVSNISSARDLKRPVSLCQPFLSPEETNFRCVHAANFEFDKEAKRYKANKYQKRNPTFT